MQNNSKTCLFNKFMKTNLCVHYVTGQKWVGEEKMVISELIISTPSHGYDKMKIEIEDHPSRIYADTVRIEEDEDIIFESNDVEVLRINKNDFSELKVNNKGIDKRVVIQILTE